MGATYIDYLKVTLDIVLASYLFYRIVLFIRGKRSVQVALVLLLLFIITQLIRALDFMVTGWLFEQLWTAALIFIVVAYHEKIKEAFKDLVKTSLIARFLRSLDQEGKDEKPKG